MMPDIPGFTVTFAGILDISENEDCNRILDDFQKFIFDKQGNIREEARPGFLTLGILANTILNLPDERLREPYLTDKRTLQQLQKLDAEGSTDEAETD